ncbi:MAG: PepSY-associated TM helix domain-containing protein [Acidimicrobiia bacterium]
MSNLEYAGGGAGGGSVPVRAGSVRTEAERADAASRRWRTIWRTHFYAGVFAAPFMVLMALTGLVILYSQPITDWARNDLRTVSDIGEWQSFDAQSAAVVTANPDNPITQVDVPRNSTSSTAFWLEDGTQVFVDPYTSEVLGTATGEVGIVGLANRLHGYLNINEEKVTVKLPSLSGILGDGAIMQEYVVGDMVLEIFGGWAFVLLVSGLYLWWPRKTGMATPQRTRSLFGLRLGKKGRARWRDMHAVSGVLMSAMLLLTLVSGMPWASYWGQNFGSLANKITPNQESAQPDSTLATRGDLDRFGNRINWNTASNAIPNSANDGVDPTTLPAQIGLQSLIDIGKQEGMKPGYSIYYPSIGEDEAGNPTYGSFTLSNSWPRKTGEAKDVYVDQFSGNTLGEFNVWGYGGISRGIDTLVSVHMGTQLGLFSRIFMTALCVLTIWSVVSAVVMYSKRRRKGTLGTPRRPRDLRMANKLIVITMIMAVLYPLWGASAFAILMLDKFVIRRNGRLRRMFGQHDRPTPTEAPTPA